MILAPSPSPHPPGQWPAPAGYLHGFLDARQPGYRLWDEGSPLQLTPALYAGDEVLGQMYLDGSEALTEWTHVNGQTYSSGDFEVTFNDRLGELLGFGLDPSGVVSATPTYAPSPSPLYLPYQGAVIREREQRRESHRATNRHGRDVQRTWGLVTLYHVTATIPAWCAPATSWYLRGGRLAVQPVGGTRVEGAIQRVALTWIGQHRAEARLELILSAEVA